MCAKSMLARINRRLHTSIVVKIPTRDSFYYGLATNLSERGMCIQTGTCLPCNTQGNLLIPIENKEIELTVRVRWIDETPGFYDAMGVELLNTTKQYRQFLQKLPA